MAENTARKGPRPPIIVSKPSRKKEPRLLAVIDQLVDQAGQIWRCLVYRNAHQDTSFKPSAKPGHYGVAVFYADNQSDPNTGWILLRKVGWNRGPGQWCGAWRAVHYADNRVTPFDGRAIDLDALRRARGDQAYIDRVDADVE